MTHKPWYDKGLRFSCTRSGNCCRTHGEYAYVYLTTEDVEAIAAHLELAPATFLRRYCAEDEGHTILRIDSVDCPFLREGPSCAIYPVRPVQCSAWPFWRENLDDPARWHGPVAECCPGVGRGEWHSAEEIDRIADELEEWYGGEGG